MPALPEASPAVCPRAELTAADSAAWSKDTPADPPGAYWEMAFDTPSPARSIPYMSSGARSISVLYKKNLTSIITSS